MAQPYSVVKAALDAAVAASGGKFQPFDAKYYVQTYSVVKNDNGSVVDDSLSKFSGDPLQHYVEQGAANGYKPNAWFDPAFYRAQYSDVQSLAEGDLLVHYAKFGVNEGRAPTTELASFDGSRYLRDNPDVAAYVNANINSFGGSQTNGAIAHYVKFGANEGRQGYQVDGDSVPFTTYAAKYDFAASAGTASADTVALNLNTNAGKTMLTGANAVIDGGAGTDTLRLTGDAHLRIDLTNSASQLRGLDLDGDGTIEANGVENNVSGAQVVTVKNFELVDAYARNPLNTGDVSKNFKGDIKFDGTAYGGDGVSTDGNIVLGGLGADAIFGGVGNDFLTGGGIAQGRFVPKIIDGITHVIDTRTGLDAVPNNATGSGAGALPTPGDFLSGGRNADFAFVEVSALDRTDGAGLLYDGGETADNVAGTQATLVDPTGLTNDRDWVLVEASDDDEATSITLSDATAANGVQTRSSNNGGTSNQGVGGNATLVGVEAIDASGNLYGLANDIAVQLGNRAVDARSAAPVAGTENYGVGSTAQLLVTGSDSANIVVGGYDNDSISGAGGNDVLFGGNLEYLGKNQNNKNLVNATGGLDLNVNAAKVVNDGRDVIAGGNDNDAIVYEADNGRVSGDAAFDTLYITNESVGRLQGTNMKDAAYVDSKAQTDALAALTTDQVLRFDLDNGAGGQNRDYGGANRGLGIAPVESATADQTNYVAALGAKPSVTVGTVEGLIATGLGDIDYKAAGTNSPELTFNNQQNYQGSIAKFDVRGVNSDEAATGVGGFTDGDDNGSLETGATTTGSTTKFGSYWTDRNFGQDGAGGNLRNNDVGAGSSQVAYREAGDNLIYTSIANDTLEGRLGDDELGGNKGDDNFVFDFGDSTDIIRRQADANGDNLWDTDAAGNRQYAQDFRADPSGVTATRLQIDFGATDLTSPNVVVGNIFLTINPGKGAAGGELKIQAGDLSGQRSIAAIADAANKAFSAIDSSLSVVASGNSLLVSDTKGRDISDTPAEGYAVFVSIGNSSATTNAILNPGGATLQENDRIIFVDYLDRVNNSLVNNATDELRNQAQDLVIGTGTTTTLANGQEWRIQLQNLGVGDKVDVNINGTVFSRTVLTGETTDNFVANFVTQINTATLDRYTAAGHLAAVQDDVNAGANAARESVLVLTQNAIGAGENKVYMAAPTVTITAVNGAASSASSAIANTSATSIELYNFDGRNGNLNADDVLFIGRSGQSTMATKDSTAILQIAKDAGETLTGKDASVVLKPATFINLGNTNGDALGLYQAINGDDQFIGGNGNDTLNGGTGDDRFVGSKGTDTIDGGGNVTVTTPTNSTEIITFVDSILFQENDFGAGSKFTITVDSDLDAKGKGVVTAVDSKGGALGTTTFSNIEEIRTASNTAQDTIDYSGLSNKIASTTGTSSNLDQAALIIPTVAATNYNEGTLLKLTSANAGLAFAVDRNGDDDTNDAGEINSNPVAVYGVENVIGGAANDVVAMDETQAGSSNNINLAGELSDLTPAPATFTEGRDLVTYDHSALAVANRPTMTVTVESASNTDTVAVTGGAVGTATVTDTLTGVEYVDVAAAATNKLGADVLDLSKVAGATVNFGAGAVTVGRSLGGQQTANSVVAVEANTLQDGGISTTAANLGNELLQVTGITQLEKITGSTGADRIIVGDGSAFANANFNLAATVYDDAKLGFNFHNQYSTATRSYTTTTLVDNKALYQINLGDGSDTVDYRQSNDGVAVVVDFTDKVGDYVVVDEAGAAGYFTNGSKDRIDLVQNAERYFGANQAGRNNAIDLSQATEAVTVSFGAESKEAGNEVKDPNGLETNAVAGKSQDNQVTGINVSTATNASVARFMESSVHGDGSSGISPNALVLWERIEGSNQNDTVKFSQYQDRLAAEELNLRGGNNTVDYSVAIKTGQNDVYTLAVSDVTPVLSSTFTHAGYTVTHTSTDDVGTADLISLDRQVNGTNTNTDGTLTVIGSNNSNDVVTIAALAAPQGLEKAGGANDLAGANKAGTAVLEEANVRDITGTAKGGFNQVDLGSGVGVTSGQVIQDYNLNFKGQAAIDDNVVTSVSGFENIVGSANNDRLYGNDSSNAITGGGGADIYVGRGGGDSLTLGAGDDRVVFNGPGDSADVAGAASLTANAGEYDQITAFGTAGNDRIAFDLTTTAANGGFNLVSNLVQVTGTGGATDATRGGIVLVGNDDAVLSADALNMTKVVTGLGTAATLAAGVAVGTQLVFAVDTTDKVGLYLWTAGTAADTTVQDTELRLLAQFQDDNDVAGGLGNSVVQDVANINAANFVYNTGAIIVAENDDLIAANTGAALDAAITKDFTAAQANGTQAVFAIESTAGGLDQVSYFLWTSANADAVVDAAEIAFLGTTAITKDIVAGNAAAVGAQAAVFGNAAILATANAADLFTGSDLAVRQLATNTGLADTVLFNDAVRNEIVYTALNQSQYGQIDTIGRMLNGAVANGFVVGQDKIDLSGLGLGTVDGLAVNAIITRDRSGAGSQITDANANDFFYDAGNVRRAVVVEYDNDDIDAATSGTQARARVFVDLNGDGQLNTTSDLFIDLTTDGTSTNAAVVNINTNANGTGYVPGYNDFIFVV